MSWPGTRLRRLRRTPGLRALVRETRLGPGDLVAPAFVVPGKNVRKPIDALPGVDQVSADQAAEDARRLADLGVTAILLFGLPATKDETGSAAWAADGPVPSALRALRKATPNTVAMADVCLCEYTSHGHCGVLEGESVANDPTLELLGRTAVAYAEAGADVVAPSDMMDGRVKAIRAALDTAGHAQTAILSYAAKYASAFYGPFREAAGSTPALGDRRGYQMDPANAREALRELELDLDEGADALLVKPALPYLDVLCAARERFDCPLAAYHVSGEYAMLKAAAARGWVDEPRAALEVLTAIRRAGADFVITYYAGDAARWLAAGVTA